MREGDGSMENKHMYVVVEECPKDSYFSTIYKPMKMTEEEAKIYKNKLQYLDNFDNNEDDSQKYKYRLEKLVNCKSFDLDTLIPDRFNLVHFISQRRAEDYLIHYQDEYTFTERFYVEFYSKLDTICHIYGHSKLTKDEQEEYENMKDMTVISYIGGYFNLALVNIAIDTTVDFDDFEEKIAMGLVRKNWKHFFDVEIGSLDKLKEITSRENKKFYKFKFPMIKD